MQANKLSQSLDPAERVEYLRTYLAEVRKSVGPTRNDELIAEVKSKAVREELASALKVLTASSRWS